VNPFWVNSSAATRTPSESATSNSMLACGTGRSAGHSEVPKQACAAWPSGQTPKLLLPSMSSLCRQPSGSPVSGNPRALTYKPRLAGASGLITATLPMNRTFMTAPPGLDSHADLGVRL